MMETPNKNRYQNIPYLGCATEYLEEITDSLDQFSLFMQFTAPELQVLTSHFNCYAAPRGYLLYEQGDVSDHLIVILSGEVGVITSGAEKYLLGPGAILGSDSFIDQHQWNTSCIVNKPTDFAAFNKEGLNTLLMHNPRLGNRFLLAIMQSMVVKIRAMEQETDTKAIRLLS